MLKQRTIVTVVLLPFGIALIQIGGWLLTTTIALVLGYAAWEYYSMFRQGGYKPAVLVLLAGVIALVLVRHWFQFGGADVLFSLVVLLSMATQVAYYETGENTAAVDFNITLGGILYLGWLGSYLVSLRQLPEGQWWLQLVLGSCWGGDVMAYLIGSRFGRHKLSRRVSPNKTWEGYLAGIIGAVLSALLLTAIAQNYQAEGITYIGGALIGLVIGTTTPLGDLGESMLKRGFGIKDSSNVLPGHGGIMDRIDSWLWAGAIGYYLILWVL